jgi:hypothetical protein
MTGGVSNFSARWMDTSSGDASPKQMLMQVAVMRKSRAIKSRIYHGTFSNACSPQRQRQKPSWSVLPIILGRDLGLNSVCPKQSPPEIHIVGPISCQLARILSLIAEDLRKLSAISTSLLEHGKAPFIESGIGFAPAKPAYRLGQFPANHR